MTNQLAANSIDGVYVCESGTKEVLRDQDFMTHWQHAKKAQFTDK